MNYQVFIASPSDCSRERKAAAAAVARIDRMIGRRLDHRLEAVGWETDSFPDARRPQDVINELLDKAAIVVVLFWHRFGTDAGKGKTGTAEELSRSLEKQDRKGSPRILLYFKEVDEDNPPSDFQEDQYQNLKIFRSAVEQSRLIYFRTFASIRDWMPQLEEALADELFRRWKAVSPHQPETTEADFLIQDHIESLTAQLKLLEITGGDPMTAARLRTDIKRLERLRRSDGS